jgi:hypothetical protein
MLVISSGYRAAESTASPERRDGVDVARAASGSMKSRAKMVVVETTSEGEAMGRAAAAWHHRRWIKVMEVPHAPS